MTDSLTIIIFIKFEITHFDSPDLVTESQNIPICIEKSSKYGLSIGLSTLAFARSNGQGQGHAALDSEYL